ncbi:hypothetical protein N7462_007790 [Penicillium macrosclerotiorum]|uniref:uncharacterized protein n=1 Tax=Penicillium macrosclerotiorum TaxID=303699 RepID=UPI0025493716|nr:uncharacterized protein N7462_007790 [Penicillium macrosclerotiorum]KAJ5679546.1 hypothetical protein N7462_007790 [Penicillium macrosclerotiorum]
MTDNACGGTFESLNALRLADPISPLTASFQSPASVRLSSISWLRLTNPPQERVQLPPPSRSNSNDEGQGYPASEQQQQQQHVVGPYGQLGQQGSQGQQEGGYKPAQNDPGWTQRVLEEMKDLFLLLNAQGQITYASPSAKWITGRIPKQLEGSLFTDHIHEDDKLIFLRDMDDSVAMNKPFRTHMRLQKTNSTYGLVEAFGHPHIASQTQSQEQNTTSQDRCIGFFLICRPFPTKNSLLLDSFLEHKIENARLMQQIARLKQEEDEEASSAKPPYSKADQEKSFESGGQGSLSDQDSTDTVAPNSDDSDSGPSGDYYSDNHPRAEGLSHIDGIEVMTGLYYGDGERSQGLSTGLPQGRLIHCDIDITTAADQARNVQEGDRRKRLKAQHVCGDCGTADSPEWRKGPGGPKTLCNACGLRWSKKEKKRQEST